jgi:hypothetical protein
MTHRPLVAALCLSLVSAGVRAEAKGERVQVGGAGATLTASSTLKSSKPGQYAASNLLDGKRDTVWAEGAKGDGTDEWVEIAFDSPVVVEGFVLVPGYAKSEDLFARNVVPSGVELQADGKSVGSYAVRYWKNMDCKIASDWAVNSSPRLVMLSTPVTVGRLRLVMVATERTPKTRHDDLVVSDWIPLVRGVPLPGTAQLPGVEDVRKLLAGLVAGGAFPADQLGPKVATSPNVYSIAYLTPADVTRLQSTLGAGEGPWSLERFVRAGRKGLLDAPVTLQYGPVGAAVPGWNGLAIGDALAKFKSDHGDPMLWFPMLSMSGKESKLAKAGGALGAGSCDPEELPSP